ncbi:hypothetical protein CHUAL_004894 [Chamberlinius hualienensis]
MASSEITPISTEESNMISTEVAEFSVAFSSNEDLTFTPLKSAWLVANGTTITALSIEELTTETIVSEDFAQISTDVSKLSVEGDLLEETLMPQVTEIDVNRTDFSFEKTYDMSTMTSESTASSLPFVTSSDEFQTDFASAMTSPLTGELVNSLNETSDLEEANKTEIFKTTPKSLKILTSVPTKAETNSTIYEHAKEKPVNMTIVSLISCYNDSCVIPTKEAEFEFVSKVLNSDITQVASDFTEVDETVTLSAETYEQDISTVHMKGKITAFDTSETMSTFAKLSDYSSANPSDRTSLKPEADETGASLITLTKTVQESVFTGTDDDSSHQSSTLILGQTDAIESIRESTEWGITTTEMTSEKSLKIELLTTVLDESLAKYLLTTMEAPLSTDVDKTSLFSEVSSTSSATFEEIAIESIEASAVTSSSAPSTTNAASIVSETETFGSLTIQSSIFETNFTKDIDDFSTETSSESLATRESSFADSTVDDRPPSKSTDELTLFDFFTIDKFSDTTVAELPASYLQSVATIEYSPKTAEHSMVSTETNVKTAPQMESTLVSLESRSTEGTAFFAAVSSIAQSETSALEEFEITTTLPSSEVDSTLAVQEITKDFKHKFTPSTSTKLPSTTVTPLISAMSESMKESFSAFEITTHTEDIDYSTLQSTGKRDGKVEMLSDMSLMTETPLITEDAGKSALTTERTAKSMLSVDDHLYATPIEATAFTESIASLIKELQTATEIVLPENIKTVKSLTEDFTGKTSYDSETDISLYAFSATRESSIMIGATADTTGTDFEYTGSPIAVVTSESTQFITEPSTSLLETSGTTHLVGTVAEMEFSLMAEENETTPVVTTTKTSFQNVTLTRKPISEKASESTNTTTVALPTPSVNTTYSIMTVGEVNISLDSLTEITDVHEYASGLTFSTESFATDAAAGSSDVTDVTVEAVTVVKFTDELLASAANGQISDKSETVSTVVSTYAFSADVGETRAIIVNLTSVEETTTEYSTEMMHLTDTSAERVEMYSPSRLITPFGTQETAVDSSKLIDTAETFMPSISTKKDDMLTIDAKLESVTSDGTIDLGARQTLSEEAVSSLAPGKTLTEQLMTEFAPSTEHEVESSVMVATSVETVRLTSLSSEMYATMSYNVPDVTYSLDEADKAQTTAFDYYQISEDFSTIGDVASGMLEAIDEYATEDKGIIISLTSESTQLLSEHATSEQLSTEIDRVFDTVADTTLTFFSTKEENKTTPVFETTKMSLQNATDTRKPVSEKANEPTNSTTVTSPTPSINVTYLILTEGEDEIEISIASPSSTTTFAGTETTIVHPYASDTASSTATFTTDVADYSTDSIKETIVTVDELLASAAIEQISDKTEATSTFGITDAFTETSDVTVNLSRTVVAKEEYSSEMIHSTEDVPSLLSSTYFETRDISADFSEAVDTVDIETLIASIGTKIDEMVTVATKLKTETLETITDSIDRQTSSSQVFASLETDKTLKEIYKPITTTFGLSTQRDASSGFTEDVLSTVRLTSISSSEIHATSSESDSDKIETLFSATEAISDKAHTFVIDQISESLDSGVTAGIMTSSDGKMYYHGITEDSSIIAEIASETVEAVAEYDTEDIRTVTYLATETTQFITEPTISELSVSEIAQFLDTFTDSSILEENETKPVVTTTKSITNATATVKPVTEKVMEPTNTTTAAAPTIRENASYPLSTIVEESSEYLSSLTSLSPISFSTELLLATKRAHESEMTETEMGTVTASLSDIYLQPVSIGKLHTTTTDIVSDLSFSSATEPTYLSDESKMLGSHFFLSTLGFDMKTTARSTQTSDAETIATKETGSIDVLSTPHTLMENLKSDYFEAISEIPFSQSSDVATGYSKHVPITTVDRITLSGVSTDISSGAFETSSIKRDTDDWGRSSIYKSTVLTKLDSSTKIESTTEFKDAIVSEVVWSKSKSIENVPSTFKTDYSSSTEHVINVEDGDSTTFPLQTDMETRRISLESLITVPVTASYRSFASSDGFSDLLTESDVTDLTTDSDVSMPSSGLKAKDSITSIASTKLEYTETAAHSPVTDIFTDSDISAISAVFHGADKSSDFTAVTIPLTETVASSTFISKRDDESLAISTVDKSSTFASISTDLASSELDISTIFEVLETVKEIEVTERLQALETSSGLALADQTVSDRTDLTSDSEMTGTSSSEITATVASTEKKMPKSSDELSSSFEDSTLQSSSTGNATTRTFVYLFAGMTTEISPTRFKLVSISVPPTITELDETPIPSTSQTVVNKMGSSVADTDVTVETKLVDSETTEITSTYTDIEVSSKEKLNLFTESIEVATTTETTYEFASTDTVHPTDFLSSKGTKVKTGMTLSPSTELHQSLETQRVADINESTATTSSIDINETMETKLASRSATIADARSTGHLSDRTEVDWSTRSKVDLSDSTIAYQETSSTVSFTVETPEASEVTESLPTLVSSIVEMKLDSSTEIDTEAKEPLAYGITTAVERTSSDFQTDELDNLPDSPHLTLESSSESSVTEIVLASTEIGDKVVNNVVLASKTIDDAPLTEATDSMLWRDEQLSATMIIDADVMFTTSSSETEETSAEFLSSSELSTQSAYSTEMDFQSNVTVEHMGFDEIFNRTSRYDVTTKSPTNATTFRPIIEEKAVSPTNKTIVAASIPCVNDSCLMHTLGADGIEFSTGVSISTSEISSDFISTEKLELNLSDSTDLGVTSDTSSTSTDIFSSAVSSVEQMLGRTEDEWGMSRASLVTGGIELFGQTVYSSSAVDTTTSDNSFSDESTSDSYTIIDNIASYSQFPARGTFVTSTEDFSAEQIYKKSSITDLSDSTDDLAILITDEGTLSRDIMAETSDSSIFGTSQSKSISSSFDIVASTSSVDRVETLAIENDYRLTEPDTPFNLFPSIYSGTAIKKSTYTTDISSLSETTDGEEVIDDSSTNLESLEMVFQNYTTIYSLPISSSDESVTLSVTSRFKSFISSSTGSMSSITSLTTDSDEFESDEIESSTESLVSATLATESKSIGKFTSESTDISSIEMQEINPAAIDTADDELRNTMSLSTDNLDYSGTTIDGIIPSEMTSNESVLFTSSDVAFTSNISIFERQPEALEKENLLIEMADLQSSSGSSDYKDVEKIRNSNSSIKLTTPLAIPMKKSGVKGGKGIKCGTVESTGDDYGVVVEQSEYSTLTTEDDEPVTETPDKLSSMYSTTED